MMAAYSLAAERARTIVVTSSSLLVTWNRGQANLVHAHHGDHTGRVSVMVDPDSAIARAVHAAPRRALPALLHVTDICPVPLRDRVRARVTLAGWLSPAPAHPRLVLRMDLARVTLADCTGPLSVALDEYARGRPDPLAHREADLLRYLLVHHRTPMSALSRLLAPPVIQHCVRILPCAIDRHGLVLRVEHRRHHTDVRLPFPRPVVAPEGAVEALHALIARAHREPCWQRHRTIGQR